MTQVIFLYGRPGVGKLTVGELLSAETGYRLLHNHAVVDLVTSLFSFGIAAIRRAAREDLDPGNRRRSLGEIVRGDHDVRPGSDSHR